MNIVLNFISVLRFQLFCQILNVVRSYDTDSQSQENDSESDEREDYQDYKRSNRDNNYDYEKENKILQYTNNLDECNSCACNKCDEPPDCCKEVCKHCPKPLSQLAQLQILSMSQMPQLSMPMTIPQILQISLGQNSISEMQVPQLQVPQMQIPQIQLPQMPIPQMQRQNMPMSKIQMPFVEMTRLPSSRRALAFSDQNLIYLPLSSDVISFLRNYTLVESSGSKVVPPINISTTTTPMATTTTTTVVTTPFNEPAENNKLVTSTSLSHVQNRKNLEMAIKNALATLSDSMKNTVDKSSRHYNPYIWASALRRTKPVKTKTDTSEYGILPISNNMAENLILETRNAKGIRP